MEPDQAPLGAELSRQRDLLRRLASAEIRRPEKPQIITVSNQKGGVGKTTTSVNLAVALAENGLNVLVIDIDPQGNASTALGIDHGLGTPSIYDVLVEGAPLAETITPSPENERLLVCPATIDLAGAEVELVEKPHREYLLDKSLKDYLRKERNIDVVLIDCPPSLGILTLNAFVAAEDVLIPIQAEYYALEGLSLLWDTVSRIREHLNPRLSVEYILMTMVDGRTKLSAEVSEEVRKHFPEQVLSSEIPRNVRVSEAPSYGRSVITYDRNSAGSLAYRLAAVELGERFGRKRAS